MECYPVLQVLKLSGVDMISNHLYRTRKNTYKFQDVRTEITTKLWIYEIQIFELRNEEINVKKILAVINATYAVAYAVAFFSQLHKLR